MKYLAKVYPSYYFQINNNDCFWVHPFGLKIHNRTAHCLYHAKIQSLEELLNHTEEDLLKYTNLGKKVLEEIKKELNKIGCNLKMEKNV